MDLFRDAALQGFVSKRRTKYGISFPCSSAVTNPTVSEDFVYEPLTYEQDIRILQLDAGPFGDEIRCTFHVCSLEFECPIDPAKQLNGKSKGPTFKTATHYAVSNTTGKPFWYTALSYVWGDSSLVEPIRCNGRTIHTTRSLYIALQYLRQSDTAVNIWVDQICINQDDLEEKTRQVILMGKIYQRAWNTHVWLGEEADNSSDVIDTLVAIKDALQYYRTDIGTGVGPDIEDFERLSIPAPDSPWWQYCCKFFCRPWFQRVWVIQEVALSRDVRLLCGRKCVSMDDLNLSALCLLDNDLERFLNPGRLTEDLENESGCMRIRQIWDLTTSQHQFPDQSTLLSTLIQTRGARATDPRDKVFGIMGLTATPIHPDYSLSVSNVYTIAARRILASDCSRLEDLLCGVDHEIPQNDSPTWVPDWSCPRQTISLGYLISHRSHTPVSGSKLRWTIDLDGTSLTISGIVLDSVKTIGAPSEPILSDLPNRDSATCKYVQNCVHYAQSYCLSYYADSSLFEAFWKTLVADRDHSGFQKAPADYADIFALLIDSATGHSPTFADQPVPKRRLTLGNLKVRRPSYLYREMQIAFKRAVKGRRFGTTARGCMGLFPRGTRLNDQISIFLGGYVPFVVRQCEYSSSYQLIGECYVHGIMEDQMMRTAELEPRDIVLI